MPIHLFDRIKESLFPYVAEVNFFLNGEPTLADHLSYMIKSSAPYTFLPKIFINGTHISDEMGELFVNAGCFVNISFDGASAEVFERVRRGARFEDVVNNITRLQKIQAAVQNPRFHLRLAVTLGSHNIEEAPKIVEFAFKYNLKDILFGAYDSGGIIPENMLMDDVPRALQNIQQAVALADQYKIRYSFPKKIGTTVIDKNNNWQDFVLPVDPFVPFYLESFNPYHRDCGYPWQHMAIRSNGLVVSCCQRQHVMGDGTHEDFLKIWNNPRYQRLRSQSTYNICLGKVCNMVDYSIFNGGGTRSLTLKWHQRGVSYLRGNVINGLRQLYFKSGIKRKLA
jgi:MoaA/NifB/PqqE/SkfB family radical SAM enzyme